MARQQGGKKPEVLSKKAAQKKAQQKEQEKKNPKPSPPPPQSTPPPPPPPQQTPVQSIDNGKPTPEYEPKFRPENPTHTCPFIAFATVGNTEALEKILKHTLLFPEERFQYPNTNILQFQSATLSAPLRLVDIRSGSTLLHFGALSNLETVKLLISYGMHPFLNARNRSGFTPIFLAAGRGHLDIVRFLVETGANINIHTKDGSSVLHAAVMSGNYDLVYYLLSLPKIEVNVDDDEFMTPAGLVITRISELKKQLVEMETLLEETVSSIMADSASFIIDENEIIDEKRQKLGLPDLDDDENDPDLKFMTVKDQKAMVAELIKEDETISSLKNGIVEGTKLLENCKKIAKILIKPPIYRLTVPEMIHTHRAPYVKPVLVQEQPVEAEKGQNGPEKEKDDEKGQNADGTDDTDDTEDTEGAGNSQDENQKKTAISQQTNPPENEQSTIKLVKNDNMDDIDADEEDTPPAEWVDQMVEIFHHNGKKYTRRPAQQIIHTPDRAKIIHLPPFISYWMLLVETQDLELIRMCLESSDIDVNARFPLGSKVTNATALHYAVDLGNIDLIKLLIDFGADPGAEIELNVPLSEGQMDTSAMVAPIRNEDGDVVKPSLKDALKTKKAPTDEKIIDQGHELLVSFYQNVKDMTKNHVATHVHVSNEKLHKLKSIKKHQYVGFVSQQQGFTPLLAALYNKEHKIAKFLIQYCHSRCLGPTYLSTHTLCPYPNLLTPELLETLPLEDIESKFEQQQQNLKTVLAQNSEINEQNLPNSELTTTTITPPRKITSLMELLQILSPFLTISSASAMQERRINQMIEKDKKRQAQLNREEMDDKNEDSNENEDLNPNPTDMNNPMIPDPLRVAINNEDDGIVHALLTLGVDINSPYFQAHITMVKNRPLRSRTGEEYEYNVSIELTDLGFTPLYNAIKTKNNAVCRQLLSIGSCLDSSLHQFLLSKGINLNETQYLPLYPEYMQNCIKNEHNTQTLSPLFDKYPQQKVRLDFYSPTASLPPIIQAVQYNPDVLHMLVAHQSNILTNTTNEGRNALHYAAELNKPVLSTYLLSNDPLSMFYRDHTGLTPLALAAGQDHSELTQVLTTFLRRIRSPLVMFHPNRPVIVLGGDDDDGVNVNAETIKLYYETIDGKFSFFPKIDQKGEFIEDLDDIDVGTNNDEDDTKHDDNDTNDNDNNNDNNNNKVQKSKKNEFICPSWVDLIAEQSEREFALPLNGFDHASYKAYHQYIHGVFYPFKDDTKSKNVSLDQQIKPFVTYEPTYTLEEFDNSKQQLQTQPFRWLGFDIACANFLSFYYNIVNNHQDVVNEQFLHTIEPLVNNISGIYGHVIRAFRIAALTGSIFTLKQLSNLMFAYPQILAKRDALLSPFETMTTKSIPSPTKPYSLWVELVVPTEEQFKTRITTAGGFQLLKNNIVVDQHGFIVRNVTYEYAAEVYKSTIAKGMISPDRLCVPLISYLSTESLSSITKSGYTFILGEALGNQALPLLHGLRGTTFIRAFHQFYTCNPLLFDSKFQTFNFNGMIKNRNATLPFTPFMKDDIFEVSIPMSKSSNHFIVSKTVIQQRQNDKDDKNDDDGNHPALLDKSQQQSLVPINLYKAPTFSPLHLAVANDHISLIRLLIGLEPFPTQNEDSKGDDGHDGGHDGGNENGGQDDQSSSEFQSDKLKTLKSSKKVNTNGDDSDDDDDIPDVEFVNDEYNQIGHNEEKSFEDIMLQPEHSETLAALVKALNIIPQNPNEMFSLGPDMEQGGQNDEIVDQSEKAEQNDEQGEDINNPIKLNQNQQEMFGNLDLQAMLAEMTQNIQNEDSPAPEQLDNVEKKSNAPARLLKMPPLLHVPQPNDAIFQFINRLTVRTMTIQDDDVEDVEDVENVGKEEDTASKTPKTIDTILHVLHLCALQDLVDCAEILIQYGAIIDIQDHDGNTPLHVAIRDGSRFMIDLLISYRANLNAKNALGNTPVHMAILNGNIDLANVLIQEYRADTSVVNNDGKSVADMLDESNKKYQEFLQEDAKVEDNFADVYPDVEQFISGLQRHETDPRLNDPKLKLSTLTPEERRQHNLKQMQTLKKELDKFKE
jgi:ankyrin repeat protein